MNKPLRVLIVEDSEFDALLLVNVLRKGGYAVEHRRVDTRESMDAALHDGPWDIVLSDYNMPNFTMFEALELLQQSGKDLPFIIVSGGIGEDIAVAAMKAGAHDYLMKGNLVRLVPAVERELREAASRAARCQAEAALRESELRYRLLWETSTDAVVFVDAQGIIHFANPAVETIFGYRPEEVLGKNLALLQSEVLHAAPPLPGIGAPAGASATSHKSAREAVGRHKEGRAFPIDIAFSELEWQGANWVVAFIRDISERKQAEQAMRQTREQFRVAREIQQRLFPKRPPHFPEFELAGASFPAEATGGDYFDYLPLLNSGLGIVVGDVSGHGVGPALLMAETRAYLRLLARNREDLGEILARANRIIAEDVGYERFITLLLARVDAKTKVLTYASAGHPPGYLLDADGSLKHRLKRTGLPLGLQPGGTKYLTAPPVPLASGDVLVLLTDGVEEAMSAANEFFGTDRILEVVRAHRGGSSQQIVQALYQAVRDFARNAPQLDDVTVVVAKIL